MSRDNYISLLEVGLACARQRNLVLEAKCAMFGDTGDNILSPTPPKSPPLLLTPCSLAGPMVTRSKVGRAPQTSQTTHSCLRGKSHSRVVSAPEALQTRKVTSCSSSHKQLVSFASVSTPPPVKKTIPGSTRITPHPATQPYMAELHCSSGAPSSASATPRSPSGAKSSDPVFTASRNTSTNTPFAL
jgi:hypothetical protein